ncbi:hypothetical protein [Streptomyces sp. NBC_01445]|uniref:hypothetical protein n=1 Tax=Streptomyces sp. NBC_01445 TaxID=2903869 RepID=UPI002DDA8B96|nr:hypothetical protein [Streptomyces sp. NBC_01445]WSE09562.1 hypothetical protein OG574_43075 [Streptomyces sp. NBC_01445]
MTAAAVVALCLGLTGGCSFGDSTDPKKAAAQQQRFCAQFGQWQQDDATHDVDSVSAQMVVDAAKVLDREHLDTKGSHILRDTEEAVVHHIHYSAVRVTAYCDRAGFEMLVASP